MKTPMPKIDLNKLAAILTPAELKLAQRIVNPKTGALRASKPPVKHIRQTSVLKHGCLPICADGDLPVFGAERRALTTTLDAIVKKIVDTLPSEEWHGIKRWGQAYGLVGTPQVRESGSIVYR
jgi:hypothetical protein